MKKLENKIKKFIKERDSEQFHNPKDLSISLALEAAEVLEHFQWKNPEKIELHIKENIEDIEDELVDVLYWVLLMSHYLDVDLYEAFERKMSKNEEKYPIEKSKGRHSKYNKL